MSDRIATVVHEGRVFIAMDTLRMGMEIIRVQGVPAEVQFMALEEVLNGIEEDSLNV